MTDDPVCNTSTPPSPLVRLGGFEWSPLLVGWGSPGRTPNREIHGYLAKKAGPGRMGDEERTRRTVNLWTVEAVYALHSGQHLLYVGEGQLGPRLLEHYRNDSFAGRWDSFTWLSAYGYQSPPEGGRAAIVSPSNPIRCELSSKQLIERLELLAICLARPSGNSQTPSADDEIDWLTQVRSEYAEESVEEGVAAMRAELTAVRTQLEAIAARCGG